MSFNLLDRERLRALVLVAFSATALAFAGCASTETWDRTLGNDTSHIDRISASVDNPRPEVYPDIQVGEPITPRTIRDLSELNYTDISLDEVLQLAMQKKDVLRELGGTILRNPESIQTRYTTGLQETNPLSGVEAALSAFDAQLDGSAFFNNNDRVFNNPFFAGGTNAFIQDLHDYSLEVSKLTATGSRLAVRSITNYDSNNAPGNTFPSAWDTFVEGEIRQPLLQGAGLEFNRIAGPNATEGIYNGVLIARVRNDINQTDFEAGVRDYVSNCVNTYWDLYFAYRDLDARRRAMQRALETWRKWKAIADSESEANSKEALAREQYYRFRAEVDEALTGTLTQGTQNRNGSTGGTLRGSGGVQVAERRLRLLIGMPITDGTLLRPSIEPEEAELVFDWNAVLSEALSRRPELRSQQLRVKQREMEVLAARNFLNPRLDAVGRYRWRGFGDRLIDSGNQGAPDFASAAGNLFDGDQQEWQVGVELSVPLGYRRAHAAVSHAELMLAREKSVHHEQQREVVHDLSNAITDVDRAYITASNNLNRYLAAREVLKALEAQEANELDVEIDRILDAQRRVVEAEIRYFRSRAEYAIACKNVHFEKGSIMAYNNIGIFDGVVPLSTDTVGTVGRTDHSTPQGTGTPIGSQYIGDPSAVMPVEIPPAVDVAEPPAI